ncbi:FixH family protein [Acidimangrovimonas sediminis]|uniref:FixH family protein n=1 Tax=Acidimangrovimonas sediminis TaxID=2056283 RepID=UPI000C7FC97F|nr:FixH family protein [Acidimangrovimonas sediminis]
MAEITGRHVLAGFVGAFGIIIAVNVVMAYQAVHTFPGLEVENGYVESQTFDRDQKAQKALGWGLKLGYAGKVLSLGFDRGEDPIADVASLDVLVGRPTEAREDKHPVFSRNGDVFSAPLDLHKGKWMVVVQARATDGTRFRQRLSLNVTN